MLERVSKSIIVLLGIDTPDDREICFGPSRYVISSYHLRRSKHARVLTHKIPIKF
jgi:hypothetical protein